MTTTTTTTTRRSSAHAYRFALVGGLSFGYDLALVGGILRAMRDALGMSAGARGAVVAAVKVGAIVGAFVGAGSMRSAGRRWAAVTTTAACSLVGGGTTWAFARWTSVGGIAFGRMVLGVGIGALAVIAPAYCGECSEASVRGAVGASYELSVCAGMVLANAMTWWKPEKTYGLLLLSPGVVGFWSSMAFAMTRESPRWLVRRGMEDEARAALREAGADEQAVEEEIGEIMAEERAMGAGGEDDVSFMRAFRDAVVDGAREAFDGDEKRAVRLALALAVFNQMCASTSVINYSSSVLRNVARATSGTTDESMDVYNLYTSLLIVCKTGGVVASISMVDRVGRRPLLFIGSIASGLSLGVVCFGYAVYSVALTLLGMCAFMLAFASSFASIYWIVVSEMFSMRAKRSAIAFVTAALFASGALSDLIFPSLLASMGAVTFAFYACVCFAAAAFVHAYVPRRRENRRRRPSHAQTRASSDGRVPTDGRRETCRISGIVALVNLCARYTRRRRPRATYVLVRIITNKDASRAPVCSRTLTKTPSSLDVTASLTSRSPLPAVPRTPIEALAECSTRRRRRRKIQHHRPDREILLLRRPRVHRAATVNVSVKLTGLMRHHAMRGSLRESTRPASRVSRRSRAAGRRDGSRSARAFTPRARARGVERASRANDRARAFLTHHGSSESRRAGECAFARARGSGVKTPLEVMVFARVRGRPREGREERRRRRERTNERTT